MNKKFKSLTLLLALTTATTQPMMQAIKNAVYGKAASESRGLGLKKFFTPGFKLFTPQFMQKAIKNHPYFVLGATLFGVCGVGLAGCYLYKRFFTQTPKNPIKSINELSEAKRADAIKEIFGACAYDICEAKDLELALTWLKKFLPTNENGQCLYHAGANVTYTIPVADILKHNDPNGYTLMSLAIQQKNKPEILKYIQELYIQHLPMPIPTQQQQQQASSSSSQTQQQATTSTTATTATTQKPQQQQGGGGDIVTTKDFAEALEKNNQVLAAQITQALSTTSDILKNTTLSSSTSTSATGDGKLQTIQPSSTGQAQQQATTATTSFKFEFDPRTEALAIGTLITSQDPITELEKAIASAEKQNNLLPLFKYCSRFSSTPYLKNIASAKANGDELRKAKNEMILDLYKKHGL